MTALDIACKNNFHEIVRILLSQKGINVNLEGINGMVALHHACKNGSNEAVKLLLDFPDIEVNRKNKSNEAPLHLSCCNGHINVIETIIKHNEKINQAINQNQNQYNVLTDQQKEQYKQLFIANYEECVNHRTPLLIACFNKKYDLVSYMIQTKKFQINVKDGAGLTPLHFICQDVNDPINMKLDDLFSLILSEDDIDIDVPDYSGNMPLHFLCKSEHPNMINKFIEYLKQTDKLDQINCNNKAKETPLFIACQNGKLSTVEILCREPTVDINARDKKGWTPLHAAVYFRHNEIVQFLVSQPNIKLNEKEKIYISYLRYFISY